MVSFYPGPSKVNSNLERYFHDALEEGILSQNHRSQAFMKLHEHTVTLLKKHLYIPANYSIYFVSSATECWEIVSQDLSKLKNVHVYNGAFGEKWFQYHEGLNLSSSKGYSFHPEDRFPVEAIEQFQPDVIHVTQNETSNGTRLSFEDIKKLRTTYPKAFIAVDATSSLGGEILSISDADVWFASVQKCFGLPAGMAVLICSDRIVDYCKSQTTPFYNSIRKQEAQYIKHQTTHTPNVLGIYLLNKIVTDRTPLEGISEELERQAFSWYNLFSTLELFTPLIANASVRSSTVIAVKGEENDIEDLKKRCLDKGFILGNGYGEFQDRTFRIANFPAHQKEEIKELQNIIAHF